MIRLLATGLALLLGLTACSPNNSNAPTDNSIESFTRNMTRQAGLIPVIYDQNSGKAYLEITRNGPEYIYYFSLPQGLGSNDIGLDRGQLMDLETKLVRFADAGDKVLLQQRNTYYRAVSDNDLEQQSVSEAFASSVLWGFPVVARSGEQLLIDATEFMLRDSHGVARKLKHSKQGEYRRDASRSAVYLPRTKAFPRNTELEATVTFTGDDPGEFVQAVAPDPYSISVRMHHSFVALPEAGFEPRAFHPQSGFWAFEFKDYAAPIDADMTRRWIPRHRLQKKDPKAQVSAAIDPIIYYLDPGTPEPVRSALIEGGRWWNQAFEAAGYRDAFQIKMLPADADPMDVRYNVIQWVHRATRGWSYGYGLTDPRTGEIIKGHVTLGSLRVRQDFLIAQGMTAPFDTLAASTQPMRDMALARIRQLSAHEIGHTLGIAHNFAASPKDRASVMDYPHPQLSINDGNISLVGAYAENIGDWDKRVVQYGYGSFDSETARLNFIAESTQLGFKFISDPDSRSLGDFHATSSLWDNGANAADELARVVELRTKALAQFSDNALAFGRPYSDLEEILVPVYYYHRYQAEAAGKLLGGYHYDYGVKTGAAAQQLSPVSAADQRHALSQLTRTLSPDFLLLPAAIESLIPPKAYGHKKTRESTQGYTGALLDPLAMAEAAANHSLNILLHPERLARLQWAHASDDAHLSPTQVLDNIWAATGTNGAKGKALLIARQTEILVLHKITHLLANNNLTPQLRGVFGAFLARRQIDAPVNTHERLLAAMVNTAQSLVASKDAIKPKPLPPGSPI
ncbi:zinc-dependent metalloprotease [Simiduia aestuariiviva]|uniref:DUF5117 domain-containing protein n=1 Tax=Simiduia aestuariiviva TaxID=1510459 RepID=A0A839USX3_9GAMM|nr:zinc-dependent metalloprotease [Simiduia aestuariiviva]MBB3169550.1 hypothetical protein [Simiduia aestuariiviva]